MYARIARLGVLTAAVTGLMATMIPSASATTVKEIVFTGHAYVPPWAGLGYPGAGWWGPDVNKIPCTNAGLPDTTCVTFKRGPKGEAQLNFTPEGNHSSFSFSSYACAKATVSTKDKTTGPQVCVIRAAGAVWGYCGLSTGLGVVTIDDTTPVTFLGTKQSQPIEIKFTEVGGAVYLTGGDQQTNIYGVLTAIPVTGSCTNKSATGFLLTGVATYKDCTTSVRPVC